MDYFQLISNVKLPVMNGQVFAIQITPSNNLTNNLATVNNNWLNFKVLTTYEFLSILIQIAFVVVTSYTLYFLNRQITVLIEQTKTFKIQANLLEHNLKASAFLPLNNYQADLNKIFIENPDFRQYFYDGVEISKNDNKYNKVISIADFMLDFFDAVFVQKSLYNLSGSWWIGFMTKSFITSPTLCKRLDENSSMYTEKLHKLKRRALESRRKYFKNEHNIAMSENQRVSNHEANHDLH